MSAAQRFRVAICGGGIAGLTLAVALSKYPDIDITIYEAATKLTEVGAGLGLFPRVWDIIRGLGLEADLLATTENKPTNGPVPIFRYRKSDQPEGLEFYTLVTQGNLIRLHRADFQATLLRHLSRTCRIACSKRLASYIQRSSGAIDLFFEDGSTAQCDVLVGADGYKSVVRRCILEDKARQAHQRGNSKEAAELRGAIDASFTGQLAYRALIPGDKLRALSPAHSSLTHGMQYLGRGGYVIAYPIQHGRFINFVYFDVRPQLAGSVYNGPWVSMADKSDFMRQFTHWEREVQDLVQCAENPLKWAIHTVKPMKSFIHGHAVLLGDAAHAMAPHQGSGAGQAIEDAYILATVLGHRRTTRETLGRALAIHDGLRRPFALWAHERSRLNGLYFSFEFDGANFDHLSDRQVLDRLRALGITFTKNWEWAWTTTLEKTIQEAVRQLES